MKRSAAVIFREDRLPMPLSECRHCFWNDEATAAATQRGKCAFQQRNTVVFVLILREVRQRDQAWNAEREREGLERDWRRQLKFRQPGRRGEIALISFIS
jgi:hypothetical protein